MSNQLSSNTNNTNNNNSNKKSLVRETLRQTALCRFVLNYEDNRTSGRLFGFGAPLIGDASTVKPYTSRLLMETIWPSRIEDGEVLYNYQLATVAPPRRYNTSFEPSKLELVFGCLGLRPRFEGLKGLRNVEPAGFSYFFREIEDLLRERQMPLQLPSFTTELGGIKKPIQDKKVMLDTVHVELPNSGNWMVTNRGELQKPESGIYGTWPLSKLQYDNQKARELNPEVPLLMAYERPEPKHRGQVEVSEEPKALNNKNNSAE